MLLKIQHRKRRRIKKIASVCSLFAKLTPHVFPTTTSATKPPNQNQSTETQTRQSPDPTIPKTPNRVAILVTGMPSTLTESLPTDMSLFPQDFANVLRIYAYNVMRKELAKMAVDEDVGFLKEYADTMQLNIEAGAQDYLKQSIANLTPAETWHKYLYPAFEENFDVFMHVPSDDKEYTVTVCDAFRPRIYNDDMKKKINDSSDFPKLFCLPAGQDRAVVPDGLSKFLKFHDHGGKSLKNSDKVKTSFAASVMQFRDVFVLNEWRKRVQKPNANYSHILRLRADLVFFDKFPILSKIKQLEEELEYYSQLPEHFGSSSRKNPGFLSYLDSTSAWLNFHQDLTHDFYFKEIYRNLDERRRKDVEGFEKKYYDEFYPDNNLAKIIQKRNSMYGDEKEYLKDIFENSIKTINRASQKTFKPENIVFARDFADGCCGNEDILLLGRTQMMDKWLSSMIQDLLGYFENGNSAPQSIQDKYTSTAKFMSSGWNAFNIERLQSRWLKMHSGRYVGVRGLACHVLRKKQSEKQETEAVIADTVVAEKENDQSKVIVHDDLNFLRTFHDNVEDAVTSLLVKSAVDGADISEHKKTMIIEKVSSLVESSKDQTLIVLWNANLQDSIPLTVFKPIEGGLEIIESDLSEKSINTAKKFPSTKIANSNKLKDPLSSCARETPKIEFLPEYDWARNQSINHIDVDKKTRLDLLNYKWYYTKGRRTQRIPLENN